VSVKQAVSRKR